MTTDRTLDRDALAELIAEHLSGTYHCTRVWSAWGVGTMTQDDFEPADESHTPGEIADAIIAKLNADRAQSAQAVPSIEDLCARIKAADDAAADNDYMLDSDDCIKVLRGEWKAPLAMDKPALPTPKAEPAPAAVEPVATDSPPLTPDEARQAARFADMMRGPSDTMRPADYAMAGALALAAKIDAQPAVEPVAWRHTNRLGGVQVFTTEPPPGLKERCQPLFTSTKAPPADALDADMYWDDADPEMGYESIGELLDNMISHGGHEVGDTLTLQRAHRLPNITIRITSIDDEEGDAEYEVIDAAMAAQGAEP